MLAYLCLWMVLFALLLARQFPHSEVTVVRAPEGAARFQLDLNRATWREITLLEGIGETLARRIVAARQQRVQFTTLEEVMELPGIPDRPFEAARDWLVVLPL